MNKYKFPERMADEIRLGTTLADVMPVQEPAGWTAAVVCSLSLVGWRRRLVSGSKEVVS
jgi:hypothetical protein